MRCNYRPRMRCNCKKPAKPYPTPPEPTPGAFSPNNSILVEPTRGNAILKFFAVDNSSEDYVYARLISNNKLGYIAYYGACEGDEYCEGLFENESVKEELGAEIGGYIDEHGIPAEGVMKFTDGMYSVIENYFAGTADVSDVVDAIESGGVIEPEEPTSIYIESMELGNTEQTEIGVGETVYYPIIYSPGNANDYSLSTYGMFMDEITVEIVDVNGQPNLQVTGNYAQEGMEVGVEDLVSGAQTGALQINVVGEEEQCYVRIDDCQDEVTVCKGNTEYVAFMVGYNCPEPDFSVLSISSDNESVATVELIDEQSFSVTGVDEGQCTLSFADSDNVIYITVNVTPGLSWAMGEPEINSGEATIRFYACFGEDLSAAAVDDNTQEVFDMQIENAGYDDTGNIYMAHCTGLEPGEYTFQVTEGENTIYAHGTLYSPCDPENPDYDICNPDCPGYEPCACDTCSPDCPDRDPCACDGDCGDDPCNPDGPNYDPCFCDPCNPDCPDRDPCECDGDCGEETGIASAEFPSSGYGDGDWNYPEEAPYIIYYFRSSDSYADIEPAAGGAIVSRFSTDVTLLDSNGVVIPPTDVDWESLVLDFVTENGADAHLWYDEGVGILYLDGWFTGTEVTVKITDGEGNVYGAAFFPSASDYPLNDLWFGEEAGERVHEGNMTIEMNEQDEFYGSIPAWVDPSVEDPSAALEIQSANGIDYGFWRNPNEDHGVSPEDGYLLIDIYMDSAEESGWKEITEDVITIYNIWSLEEPKEPLATINVTINWPDDGGEVEVL